MVKEFLNNRLKAFLELAKFIKSKSFKEREKII